MGDAGAGPATASGIVFLLLWAVLRRRALRVRVVASVWVASLVVTQLSMKTLASPPFHFRFPASVTTIHFACTWGVCVLHWLRAGELEKCRWRSIGSFRRYATNIVPVACSLPLAVILNNQAMIYVGVAVNAVIASTTPVATAVLSHFFGSSLSMVSWSGVGVACLGAVIITWGETKTSFADRPPEAGILGFILSFAAVLCRSLKSVIQDKLLQPRTSQDSVDSDLDDKPLEPLHVWALQAPPCFTMALTCALSAESLSLAWSRLTPAVVGMILFTCVTATLVNLLGILTVKELGATSTQIIGKLNTIITVSLSVSLLGEKLAYEVLFGACVVLAGVSIFEYGSTHQSPLLRLKRRASLEPPIGV